MFGIARWLNCFVSRGTWDGEKREKRGIKEGDKRKIRSL
jgi:hypothetical protein